MTEKQDSNDNSELVLSLSEPNRRHNDFYVVQYDMKGVDATVAKEEVLQLLHDTKAVGLQSAVRIGAGSTLLIVLQTPPKVLGNAVHRSRIKEWLYGIIDKRPPGDYNTIATPETDTESLRSVYHLVTWEKQHGGAGIVARHGRWQNVKAVFPVHEKAAARSLLVRFSRELFLKRTDLDDIRAMYGEKTAFYFAFMQTYIFALIFPAVTGLLAWMFLHRLSAVYAITTTIWCIVFVEYWRLEEISLSLRWSVRGVGSLKVNRREYVYEKETKDPITGETQQYFPKRKQVLRQLASIPFALAALIVLGAITTGVFGIELFLSHVYSGSYKAWLEYLPTVLLALGLPYIREWMERMAVKLAEHENWRTQDRYEMSLTLKVFVLNFITSYLPILLSAFLYIPFGDNILSSIRSIVQSTTGIRDVLAVDIHVDTSRLRSEVIALTVTDQISGFGEELILPMLKLKAAQWYGDWRGANKGYNYSAMSGSYVAAAEVKFLNQIRDEAEREPYNVHEDIQQMVTQFGYLALFSPVWPLVPIGFLLNNWIELRSDLLKIAIDHQRPDPVRTDGIGAWLDSLVFLSWLGSIVTAAIVHLFRDVERLHEARTWWTLPVTIFVAEHIYLLTKYVVRAALEQLGTVELRQKKLHEYANRKEAFQVYMNDESVVSTTAVGGHLNTEDIRDEHCKLASKTEERLEDIKGMIDYLKAETKKPKRVKTV